MKLSVRENYIEEKPEDHRVGAARIGQRIVILLTIAAIVLGVYFFRGEITAWFRQLQAAQQTQDETVSEPYSRIAFEPDSDNVYALVNDCLAVINKGNFKLYGSDGKEKLALQLSYSRPALCKNGDTVIAYDREGTKLTVAGADALVGTLDIEGKIISVESNDKGLFSVTREDERYRSVVAVYDEHQNMIYQWQTSEYYVMRAAVSPDGKTMTATAYTQDNGVFVSRIISFDLGSGDDYRASADLEGTIVTNAFYLSDTAVCLVGDDRAVVMDVDGNTLYQYEYGNDMIKTGTAASGYAVLTMLDRTSGLGAKVVAFTADAGEAVITNANDDIRRMASCGDYVAVLYTQGIQLFNRSLEPLSEEVYVSQVRDILVDDSGRVLLIYASDAAYIDLASAFIGRLDGETEGE